jgi:hypothetical protein
MCFLTYRSRDAAKFMRFVAWTQGSEAEQASGVSFGAEDAGLSARKAPDM